LRPKTAENRLHFDLQLKLARRLLPGQPYPHRMRGSVTVQMAAPADRIWDLVADVTRIGEFSPETSGPESL
jgi:hypothetical protein